MIVPPNIEFEDFAETTAFRQVAQTIAALSTQDERIADEFRAIERGVISSGSIVKIEGDVPVGIKMKLGEFAEAISTKIWESVGRANWCAFNAARAFVRRLGLQSTFDWWDYCKAGRKPPDVPTNPQTIYAGAGWVNWGDWLALARSHRFYINTDRSRKLAHLRANAASNRLPSGLIIVSQGKSRTIFRLVPPQYMQLKAGLTGRLVRNGTHS